MAPSLLLRSCRASAALVLLLPSCATLLGADKDYTVGLVDGAVGDVGVDAGLDAATEAPPAVDSGGGNDGAPDAGMQDAGAVDVNSPDTGGPEANPTGFCATHVHMFCDDFDSDGAFPGPWASSVMGGGTGMFTTSTFTSPPNSAELRALDPGIGNLSTIVMDHACGSQPVSSVTFEFDVRLDASPSGSGSVALAGLLVPNETTSLSINANATGVIFLRQDNGAQTLILPPPPLGQWVHGTITATFGGTATATLGGSSPVSLPAMPSAPVTARLSAYAAGEIGSSLTAYFDNATCDWN